MGYTHTYAHTYTCIYTHIYIRIHLHIHTQRTYAHTYTHVHMHIHTHTHVHMHIHTHTRRPTYVSEISVNSPVTSRPNYFKVFLTRISAFYNIQQNTDYFSESTKAVVLNVSRPYILFFEWWFQFHPQSETDFHVF